MRYQPFILPAFAIAVFACGPERSSNDEVDQSNADSLAQLANADLQANEWEPLFTGTDMSGWHKYGGGPVGEAWKVSPDGSFYLDTSRKGEKGIVGGGDIVTDGSFEDYELELEWKISACGNSGIIYNVIEEPDLAEAWRSGPEMQVLDNSCHPDAKNYKHKAGDLYDLIAGDSLAVKPSGEWNTARLVNQAGHVEHWLNGQKVVEYNNTGEGWKQMIANSKFKDMPRFGSATSGKISLQDHGDQVWYRNVRVREL